MFIWQRKARIGMILYVGSRYGAWCALLLEIVSVLVPSVRAQEVSTQ
jgi:hypothetical protein